MSNENENEEPSSEADPKLVSMSQADLNKLVGAAREGARKEAEKKLMASLGVEDAEAAKAAIAAAKEVEERNSSELDKVRKAADKASQEWSRSEATAKEMILTNAIEKTLIREGLSVENAERVRRLIDVSSNDADEIKSAVEDLKKDMPSLFSSNAEPKAPHSNPGSKSPTSTSSGDPRDAALKMVYERHPNLLKK